MEKIRVIENKDVLAQKIGVAEGTLETLHPYGIGIITAVAAFFITYTGVSAAAAFSILGISITIGSVPVFWPCVIAAAAFVVGTAAAWGIQKIIAFHQIKVPKSFNTPINKWGEYISQILFPPVLVLSLLAKEHEEKIVQYFIEHMKHWGFSAEYTGEYVKLLYKEYKEHPEELDTISVNQFAKLFNKDLTSLLDKNSTEKRGKIKDVLTDQFLKNLLLEIDEKHDCIEQNEAVERYYNKITDIIKTRKVTKASFALGKK